MAGNDLLEGREQAALCLARGLSVEKTAEQVGVSARSLRRWREDGTFQATVATARRALLAEVCAALGSAARDAVDVLRDALSDDNPHVRVRAGLGILSALPAIREHLELDGRLAALEGRDGIPMDVIDAEIARLTAESALDAS